jgi:hypothetical protein
MGIQVSNVSRHFSDFTAVDDVSLEITSKDCPIRRYIVAISATVILVPAIQGLPLRISGLISMYGFKHFPYFRVL